MRKHLRRLKYISFFCLLCLFIELVYVIHSLNNNPSISLYFDGINSVINVNSNYYTVGSNNDNDNYYEKAKLTKYNSKREKKYEILYNKGYNSVFFDVAYDNEDLIAVGSYEKSDEDHDDGIRRALFVKYDKDGNVKFDLDFSMLDNSKFTDIYVLDDGYLVCGQSVYKSTKVGSKDGGAILIKYDKDGNILWVNNYGDNKTSIFNDIIVADNNIYVVGVVDNSIGIICRYDMDGNFILYNDYKYTDSFGFNDITDHDGYLYVVGSNKADDNRYNAMIVKYDYDCNYIDQVIYESDNNSRFNKILFDNKENIVVIGNTKKVKSFDNDGIIGKYSLDLKEISVVFYGNERDDYFTDFIIQDDKFLVVGYSSYEDGSYLSKFIKYSDSFKVLGVE